MQKLAHAPGRYNSRHAFFLSLQIFSGGARTSTPHNPAALTVRPEKGCTFQVRSAEWSARVMRI
jgi:hypothetical protein